MKESVTAFEKRSGAKYAPPQWLAERYKPLKPSDAVPTLFRYPGPCGLRDHFLGGLKRLGPPDQGTLWLADKLLWSDVKGAAHFGTVAILQPLAFTPCQAPRKGVYVGVNSEFDNGEVAWVPPSFLARKLPWDDLKDAAEVRNALGPRAEAEKSIVVERLNAYLEELSALEAAGAPPPIVPWCEVLEDERKKLLAKYGFKGRWTGVGAAPKPRGSAG